MVGARNICYLAVTGPAETHGDAIGKRSGAKKHRFGGIGNNAERTENQVAAADGKRA